MSKGTDVASSLAAILSREYVLLLHLSNVLQALPACMLYLLSVRTGGENAMMW